MQIRQNMTHASRLQLVHFLFGIAKADGAGVVYYNKNTPTNVYLAYKALPFQIEVFDPSAETALTMANDSNDIQVIK